MSDQGQDLVDVEERLRDALAPFRGTRLPEGTTGVAVERGRRLRRGRRVATAVTPLVAAAVVVATALGVGLATGRDDGAPEPSVVGAGWHRAAPSPLSPRTSATVLPLGDGRVLVLGGTAEDPCPPNALCAAPPEETPLPRDAALYDTATNSWQRVADPPVPVSFAATAVVGDTVYVLPLPTQFGPGVAGTTDRALLAWSATDDRWTRLPAPQAQVAGLVALDDGRLLAYAYTWPDPADARCAASCPPADLVFDPATRAWTALPRDPLSQINAARQILPAPGGALLLAEQPVEGDPNPPWLMARWDAASNTWTRLPDPDVAVGAPGWFAVDGKIVNPSGDVVVDTGSGGLKHTGGIYDPQTRTWDTVPAYNPADAPLMSTVAGGGRVVARGGVLDVAARRWSTLPRRPGTRLEYTASAVTPDGLLVEFGGVRAEGPGAWSKDALSNELWVLRLP